MIKYGAVVIAGVAGVGKTTVGMALALELGWSFCEGDDFHTPSNLKKMMGGTPLTDEDRWPWLTRIRSEISIAVQEDHPMVVTCSLLKESYRRYLTNNLDHVCTVFLTADERVIRERLRYRDVHFFPKELLQSQLEFWEQPSEGIVVDAYQDPGKIVLEIKNKLKLVS